MIYRRAIAFVLCCLWAASPVLACLPNASMSPAEMECCKKMAGNCDMGGTNHKCCDSSVNHVAPHAAIVHTGTLHDLAIMPVERIDLPQVEAPAEAVLSLPAQSPSPPGLIRILRI